VVKADSDIESSVDRGETGSKVVGEYGGVVRICGSSDADTICAAATRGSSGLLNKAEGVRLGAGDGSRNTGISRL
jgi:hypothetical protein